MHKRYWVRLLLTITALTCLADNSIGQDKTADKTKTFIPSEACIDVLRSNCNASQSQLLDELLQKLEVYGIGERLKQYPSKPPAFDALPKDETGQINWVKAYNQGLIRPRSSLTKIEEDEGHEGFYNNLIFMQVKVHLMADVVFPHGMHTYWLNCNSCHPKPFKEAKGGNNIQMKEIFDGQWCGKCHGTVAFTPAAYTNCRRCHVLPKKPLGQK